MKNTKSYFLFMLILTNITLLSAQKTYIPQVFFNKEEAKNMLKPGKSTIKGVAFGKDAKDILKIGIATKNNMHKTFISI